MHLTEISGQIDALDGPAHDTNTTLAQLDTVAKLTIQLIMYSMSERIGVLVDC